MVASVLVRIGIGIDVYMHTYSVGILRCEKKQMSNFVKYSIILCLWGLLEFSVLKEGDTDIAQKRLNEHLSALKGLEGVRRSFLNP